MANITGRIFDLGKNALLTYQQGINVTSHNIANVNTPGFSRQRLIITSNTPVNSDIGQIGAGVRADGVQRIYNAYIDGQIVRENSKLGEWEEKTVFLQRAESVFNESSGTGLSQYLAEFWNAWQDLASKPSGITERNILVGKSETLSDQFRRMYASLGRIQAEISENIQNAADQINSHARQIADLNNKINSVEGMGDSANDLRDKRETVIKDLSLLADIRTIEGANGTLSVFFANDGKPIVVGISAAGGGKAVQMDPLTDEIVDPDGAAITFSGGKIKGWMDTRDREIQQYMDDLDALALAITDEVNTLHSGGFGLDGSTGNNFFTGTGAGNIRVDSGISADVNTIASAANAGEVPGGNGNALAIAGLQEKQILNSGRTGAGDYYNSLITKIGGAVQNASHNSEYQSDMMHQLEIFRESVSGVSLDEEMIKLIQYRKAYEAAAKIITVTDELLETVMNMI
ncbi:MAG: flagellar hook-associated protein FlgK [Desulfococcaceae bacterium]|nr:flagellar hook-associated protein FlgK [Desulfococcaceae bacterium]